MIRKILVAAALAGTAAMPAQAADFRPAPFAAAPFAGYNWNGFYAGINLGYQWAQVTNSGARPDGFAGGGQVGYNWQNSNVVIGAEADLQLSGAEDTFAAYKFANPWFGTLRARAGYTINNALLYLTAGIAYGGGRVDFAGLSERNTHFGWTAGFGVEYGIRPNWSVKAEYLYVDLSDTRYALTGLNNGFESSLIRFGINYRF